MGSVQPKQCVTYSVCYVDIFCLSICPVFVQDLAAGLDIAAGFDFAVGLKMYRPKLLLLQVFCFVFASVFSGGFSLPPRSRHASHRVPHHGDLSAQKISLLR